MNLSDAFDVSPPSVFVRITDRNDLTIHFRPAIFQTTPIEGESEPTQHAENKKSPDQAQKVPKQAGKDSKPDGLSQRLADIVIPKPLAARSAPSLKDPEDQEHLSPSPPNPDQPPCESPDQSGKGALRSEWDELLLQRPRNDNPSSRPVADWLLKVMSVSNRFTFGVEDVGRSDSTEAQDGSTAVGEASGGQEV